MPPRESSAWADIRPEALAGLTSEEFERFCEDLVESEAYERHDEPDFAGSTGGPDGGRDILLTVSRQPIYTRLEYQRRYLLSPLTHDPRAPPQPTRIAYSCKTGDWLTLALRDANKGTRRAVEVLAEGGYFILLVNARASLDRQYTRDGVEQTAREHLAQAYWERLKSEDPNAADPSERIHIYDANKLARYLRARGPASSALDGWAERLRATPLLSNLEQWCERQALDRGELPRWVDDDERTRIKTDLLAHLETPDPDDRASRVACLVGKPGVGKTRLLYEALSSNQQLQQRVRIARSAEEAESSIRADRLLRRYPGLVLVIDDCLVGETREIASYFLHAATSASNLAAQLVLLVPAAPEAVRDQLPRGARWELGPLATEQACEIVAQTSDRPPTDPTVVELARLSEGFPWFARLLAAELDSAAGQAPVDTRGAMFWALASRREVGSARELDHLRLRRARSLLALSLTPNVDWDRLDPQRRERLARAVGLSSFQEIVDGANECFARGLVRRRLGWRFKYVTPQVLERELIAWLLGPDGHDPGGRNLALHGREHLDRFVATLSRLDLPPSMISGVVDTALADLRETSLAQLGDRGLTGARLDLLARSQPEQTARELRRLVASTELDELRADPGKSRRSLVWTLESSIEHPRAFEAAEAALFRLALAENEGYANNATETWAGLFVPHARIAERGPLARLELLGRRLRDDDRRVRWTALHAFAQLLSRSPFRRSRWRDASAAEAHEARLRGWSMLVDCGCDPDIGVSTSARRRAIESLRGAVALGLGPHVMDMLAAKVEDWSLDERILLCEVLEELRAYDGKSLAEPEVEASLTKLERAASPRSYRERLRLRVSGWGPALVRGDDDRLDDEIAREGLDEDLQLRPELDWLATPSAARAHMFAYAIGRNDLDEALFEDLRRIAREHPSSWQAQALIGRYIGGMARAGREQAAQALLRELQTDERDASAAALAIIELGATTERLSWLERALASDAIHEFALEELCRRHQWISDADLSSVVSLVRALAEGEAAAQTGALVLAAGYFGDDRAPPASAVELVADLLAELPPTSLRSIQGAWLRGIAMLVDADRVRRAAELAVAVLPSPGLGALAWRALHDAYSRDPSATFAAVAAGLDDGSDGASPRLVMSLWSQQTPLDWPCDEVLDWVGDDERRGRAAAGLVHVKDDGQLPALARGLIRRFGPMSSVADELRARSSSTSAPVPSLAAHDRARLTQARTWLDDPDSSVVDFARIFIEELERSHEQHAAQEDDARHRYGT